MSALPAVAGGAGGAGIILPWLAAGVSAAQGRHISPPSASWGGCPGALGDATFSLCSFGLINTFCQQFPVLNPLLLKTPGVVLDMETDGYLPSITRREDIRLDMTLAMLYN